MAVIEVAGLRKEYRQGRRPPVVALDGLDLSVPAGGVHGFLGPNGSGKTTTIRCLLGLARPTAGTCRVLGADPSRDYARVQGRVGSMIETHALFPGFTGRRNPLLLAEMAGLTGAAVEAALDRVDLAARADDLLATYSLGMRQRLGLAAALMKGPELLILDEPANGLDPAGIRDIRNLLRRLGAEGRHKEQSQKGTQSSHGRSLAHPLQHLLRASVTIARAWLRRCEMAHPRAAASDPPLESPRACVAPAATGRSRIAPQLDLRPAKHHRSP